MLNSPMRSPSSGELSILETKLEAEQVRRLNATRLSWYTPYSKQKQFHDASLNASERLLRAGNQQGKTHAGAMELAMHLTGRYPA